MSYQTRKKRISFFSKARFRSRILVMRFWKWQKDRKKKREEQMQLPGTGKIMRLLRERNAIIRKNNLRINEWVDTLINDAALNGREVTLLTQCCLSKDLEQRYDKQGRQFIPTKKECALFEKQLPDIARIFFENGVKISWIFSFNRSYLDSGRMDRDIEQQFKTMITRLAEPPLQQGWLLLMDWEDDILGERFTVDQEKIAAAVAGVKPAALQLEIDRQTSWARNEAGLKQSDEEIKNDTYYQIGCEAAEAEVLTNANSPIGEFILLPLESPERYDFFTLSVPDFKKRIVSVLSPYPWRL